MSSLTPKSNEVPKPKEEAQSSKHRKSNRRPKAGEASKSARKSKPSAQFVYDSWSMYPELHDGVSSLLEEDDLSFTFFAIDDSDGPIQTYDTNIMGRFRCSNRAACPNRVWTSLCIAITIRLYPNQQYNARVYHQRCSACESLSRPILDESYAERIVYRLKRWSGVEGMDQPLYKEPKKNLPHEKKLCEGCRHGHCKWSTKSQISSSSTSSSPSAIGNSVKLLENGFFKLSL